MSKGNAIILIAVNVVFFVAYAAVVGVTGWWLIAYALMWCCGALLALGFLLR